jgi:hypothetical protein
MTFIRVDNVVINTDYIAAVVLDDDVHSEEDRISLLIAVPQASRIQRQDSSNAPMSTPSKWLDFTGETARILRDYFCSFNHVLDLRRELPIQSPDIPAPLSVRQSDTTWYLSSDTSIGR